MTKKTSLSKKILVVDDDPHILISLEFLLRKNNYDVRVARNGTEAMDILKIELPQIVLLDIMMPDVDGYQICKHIKSSETLKDTHVVFMSAKTREEDVEKGMELGASLYVKKPFSTRDLLKDLNTLLGTR